MCVSVYTCARAQPREIEGEIVHAVQCLQFLPIGLSPIVQAGCFSLLNDPGTVRRIRDEVKKKKKKKKKKNRKKTRLKGKKERKNESKKQREIKNAMPDTLTSPIESYILRGSIIRGTGWRTRQDTFLVVILFVDDRAHGFIGCFPAGILAKSR